MKRTIKLFALVAVLAMFALPVLAQGKECTEENKAAWYDTFLKNYKGDPAQQKMAYDAAKLYLTSCPENPDDKIAAYMRDKFVVPYEKSNAETNNAKQFDDAFNNKKYAEQMRLGKLVLASNPDNSAVYIIMGVAGLGEPAILADSVSYAKKAIEMVEAGKPFKPLSSKDEALAYLNYAIGKASLQNAPTDALPYLIKAGRYESNLKKNPGTYFDIVTAYEKGPRAKLTEEYERLYKDKPITPESQLAAANIDQVIDRVIDSYARLAAVTTDPAGKKSVIDELTKLYTYRNKSQTGLDLLLSSVLAVPLPDPPKPLTSLPATPASTTPASPGSQSGTTATGQPPISSGAAKSTGTTPSTTGQNKTNSTSMSGTQPKTNGTAKPAASPTPANKKPPRRAHHTA